ncbi:lytic transglycosylase domain-containing protein [Nocardioides sambongensis]|uniref:lytic transglycosylase domain-containing protein n=1 Tax=Nocardioides sambongensis TaxID=2589074 RepID=UPI001E53EA58|nr:lytic murein transglycosylase [Nocardioides sambongensis]
MALLSTAWTASVAGIGGPSPMLAADNAAPGTLADGTSVPAEEFEDPASMSNPGSVEGFEDGNGAGIITAASTNQIPSAALAAYQRAESVINSADESCKLTWQLVAAIGRVESNHGRTGGNVLDDDGLAKPGIFGDPLNGKRKTQAISDTDGGQYDNDTRWDRAVGPMQFIPQTWGVVGVDADGDGQRNPQDIDDAALATSVYLCSGSDDLSTTKGQRAAVYRYNNNEEYVDLVLRIMDAYLEGDYTSVPNNSTAAGYIVPGDQSYNPGDDTGSSSDDEAPGVFNDPDTNTGGGSDDGDTGGDPGSDPGDKGSDGDTGSDPGDEGPGNGGNKDNEPAAPDSVGEKVKEKVDDLDKGLGGLVNGVLGLLAPNEAATACKAAFPKLTQALQYIGCLVSYGLKQ